MKFAAFGMAAWLAAGVASPCLAQDLKATQRLSDTQIGFDPSGNYANYTLTVEGPNGFHASTSPKTGTPVIDLRRIGLFDDGTYHYQLTASTDEKIPVRNGLDDGRAGGPTTSMLKSASMNGQFEVKGGTIVKPDPSAREAVKRQK